MTLTLTITSAVFSFVIGAVFAIINYCKIEGVGQVLKIWISFVRDTPVAAQSFFLYYGLANLSSLIPSMSPTMAVAVIISLNMKTFISKPIRGALISMDKGQREAVMAFDMIGFQTTIRIIVPQAVRAALPLLFNDPTNLFKMSSLTFLVGVRDVMGAAKVEGANTLQFFKRYACIILIYWVMTLIFTIFQKVLEKRCNVIF